MNADSRYNYYNETVYNFDADKYIMQYPTQIEIFDLVIDSTNDLKAMFYYLLGLIDWKIRVTRLPREVFNKRDKTTRVEVCPIITVEEQDRYNNIEEFRTFLRSTIYPIPK